MGWVRRDGVPMRALILAFFLLLPTVAGAAEPAVEVEVGAAKRSFTRAELLARPDAATIEVAKEVTSGAPMTYRAVPVAGLLRGLTLPPGSVIEAVAIDGFAAQIPLDLLLNTDREKSIAWVAIEPADRPWPKIPGKDYTAGPFYIVWTKPEASSIRSEYWPTSWRSFRASSRLPRAGPRLPSMRRCRRTIPLAPDRLSMSRNACLVTN
jgi:hypothetical protein